MRVGVLEILIADTDPGPLRRLHCRFLNRHYASIMPQAVSVWSRSLGHETFYATYWGQRDPQRLLPDDLDVVFLSAYTSASALATALGKLYRRSRKDDQAQGHLATATTMCREMGMTYWLEKMGAEMARLG